jgi:hypothetical protein
LWKTLKSMPKMLKVVIADFELTHFVDDRLEVREGTNGGQGRSVSGPQQPACCGKDEGVFDCLQGDRQVMQLSGQQTVLATDVSRGPRRLPVGVEDLSDILFPAAMVRFHSVCLSLADRAAMDR